MERKNRWKVDDGHWNKLKDQNMDERRVADMREGNEITEEY